MEFNLIRCLQSFQGDTKQLTENTCRVLDSYWVNNAEDDRAKNRQSYYKSFMDEFNLTIGSDEELSCKYMLPYSADGAGSIH